MQTTNPQSLGQQVPSRSGRFSTAEYEESFPYQQTLSRENLMAPTRPVRVDSSAQQIQRRENPPIVEEVVYSQEKVEVVPIVDRVREQIEIKPILMKKSEVVQTPTTVVETQLPAQRKELREQGDVVRLRWSAQPTKILPTTQTKTYLQPVINETIRTNIIEEIQPVIEREVHQTKVIRQMQPIYEHIVELPRYRTTAQMAQNVGYGWDQSLQGQTYRPQPPGLTSSTEYREPWEQRTSGDLRQPWQQGQGDYRNQPRAPGEMRQPWQQRSGDYQQGRYGNEIHQGAFTRQQQQQPLSSQQRSTGLSGMGVQKSSQLSGYSQNLAY